MDRSRGDGNPGLRGDILSKFALLLLLVGLAGCAATSQDNSTTVEFQTALSSEATFRNLTKPVRDCFHGHAFTSNFYPEAKEGEITVRSGGDIFVMAFVHLLVAPAGTGSKVTMTFRNTLKPLFANAPAWAKGETAACS